MEHVIDNVAIDYLIIVVAGDLLAIAYYAYLNNRKNFRSPRWWFLLYLKTCVVVGFSAAILGAITGH